MTTIVCVDYVDAVVLRSMAGDKVISFCLFSELLCTSDAFLKPS